MKHNVGVCFSEGADNLFDMQEQTIKSYFNYYLEQSQILLSWCDINYNSKLLRNSTLCNQEK